MSLKKDKFRGPTHRIQNYPAFNGKFNGVPCFIEQYGPPYTVSILKNGGNPFNKEHYISMLELTDNQLKKY